MHPVRDELCGKKWWPAYRLRTTLHAAQSSTKCCLLTPKHAGNSSGGVLASLYPGIVARVLARRYLPNMVIQAKAKLVAVVDDDELMRNALHGLLKAAGYSSRVFASAEDFLSSGLQRTTACLIADVRMPGMSGLELFGKLNNDHCGIPTIFITAHGGEKMRMEALRAGAAEFLTKPFDNTVLLQHVRAALET
jgi:CheY-like chemotaxis protein